MHIKKKKKNFSGWNSPKESHRHGMKSEKVLESKVKKYKIFQLCLFLCGLEQITSLCEPSFLCSVKGIIEDGHPGASVLRHEDFTDAY